MKVRYYLEMRTRINQCIDKYDMIHDGDTVVVGVSGGADSVCLLFLLCQFKAEGIYDIDIEVVHINHLIRPEAGEDARFVKNLCDDLGKRFGISLSYHLFEMDIHRMAKERGLSVEEAGRIFRYEKFREVLGNKKGSIAVAHHANDRAETMLFNLFRGSSLNGLSGIRAVNDDIIRPLISTEKSLIENFLKEEKLSYVTDATNLTDDYTRNKIRHNIIEYAQDNIIGSVVSNMNNAADQLSRAEDFILECVKKASLNCILEKEDGKIIINTIKLGNEHEYIIDRIIYDTITYVAKHKKDITSEHVKRVRLLLDTNGSKEVHLPYEVLALKEYDKLSIIKTNNIDTLETNYDIDAVKMNVLTDFDINNIPNGLYTKWFDYDKITSVARVRTRKEGDYLVINSSLQKKLLKDYMINEKIPAKDRDNLLLLADGNHIMWIIGKRISEYYKVTDNTKRVLEVSYG